MKARAQSFYQREMLHQYISVIYHSLQEINHLVAEGHLPGHAEKRPDIVSNVRVAQRGGLRLSDLMQTAYANSEVTVLPEVVIVGSSNNGGISYSDWYNLQEAYNNGYNNGYNSGYQSGSNTSNQQEQSWWSSWGKCAAGIVLAGVKSLFLLLPQVGSTNWS